MNQSRSERSDGPGGDLLRTSNVPTAQTLAFVGAHLSPAPVRILEIGCGDGALASRLQERGHRVVALDASADAIARARQRSVDARLAHWPDYQDAPFDVVLFTRSLHHIRPLPQAIARANELLKPGGRLLVEDFAFDELGPLAAEWLHQMLALLDGAGLLRCHDDGFADQVLQCGSALAAWQAAHDHHLHTAEAMAARAREFFVEVEVTNAPYLYRYVCPLLEESADGYRLASRLLELEERFAEVGRVPLIGRRLVGVKAF
jgi:SAM-dependent methyltransferase